MTGNNGIRDIWPEWQIEEPPLGRGSYGVVYKAVRRDHNVESYAAIKVISIPSDQSEIDSLRSEGLDLNESRTYLQNIVNDFVSEIQLMESLKGIQNIVSVEDYKVVEETDGIGWDIYIRMELLTSFNSYKCDKVLTEEDVIKLGCDICTALEICNKRNIIHRDIKPENIFVNDFGYFKLGDFGIARQLEHMSVSLSRGKGTPNYMAPEVFNGDDYDARVDICSLGLVLYFLMNGNRLPFCGEKKLLAPLEREEALKRRLRGEDLPAPRDASPEMANLILRACAFDPEARFASATEMKQALMAISSGNYQVVEVDTLNKTTKVRKAAKATEQKSKQSVNTFGSAPTKKSKLPGVIAVMLAIAILIGVAMIALPSLIDDNDTDDSGEASGESTTETVDYSKLDEERIASIISEAEVLAASEDYEGALKKIQTGLVTYPTSEELNNKKLEYTQLLEEQRKQKTLAEAESLANGENYEAAIALIDNAMKKAPEDADYKAAYERYSEAYSAQIKQETLDKAAEYADKKDYVSALSVISAAMQKSPDDAEYKAAYDNYHAARIAQIKQETLDKAAAFANSKNYAAAYEAMDTACKGSPNDADYKAKRDEYRNLYKSSVLDEAETLNKNGNSLLAYNKVNDTIKKIGADNSLTTASEKYENAYVDNIMSQVNGYLAEKKYDQAKSVLKNAIMALPNNKALSERKSEVEKYKTVPLNSLSPINGAFTWNEEAPKDPFGSDYSHTINYTTLHSYHSFSDARTFSEEYKVDETYDILSMTIAPSACTNENGYAYVQIYVNNVLRFTSSKITQKTDPQKIDIDISDAKYIKIVVNVRERGCILLANVSVISDPTFIDRKNDDNISIESLDVFNGGYVWNNEYPQDAYDTDYTNVCNYTLLEGYHSWRDIRVFSSEYYVNSKYDSLSLNVSTMKCFGDDRSISIKIYIDDSLVYTSSAISKRTAPFLIKQDLKNAKYLKIVVEGNGCVILSDVVLTKSQ